MDDAALVRRFERLRDLLEDRERLARRHRTAVDPLRQRFAGHELHLEERRVAHLLEPVQRGDVGMIERGEHAGLALEPALVLRIVRRQLVQDLDGDLAAQPDVLGAIHLAHASGAEGREDPVRADRAAWGETQRIALDRGLYRRRADAGSCYSGRRMPIRLRVPGCGLRLLAHTQLRAQRGEPARGRTRARAQGRCWHLRVAVPADVVGYPRAPRRPPAQPPARSPRLLADTARSRGPRRSAAVLRGARNARRRAGQENPPVGRQRGPQARLSARCAN